MVEGDSGGRFCEHGFDVPVVLDGLVDGVDVGVEDEGVDFVAEFFWEGHEPRTALIGIG